MTTTKAIKIKMIVNLFVFILLASALATREMYVMYPALFN